MVNLSLNTSMRSNLLSLQNTSRLQDVTQNRLATGLKVNSAIDNPSSYYTAQSLTNRASDLNALLDSMSQGIQALKNVSSTIAIASKFLEQAKSVANQEMEKAQAIISNVSNEADLQRAIDSGKEGIIVLDRDITVSANTSIVLKDGQSIVGASYLDKSKAKTTINFDFNDGIIHNGIVAANNSFFSDLTINYSTTFGQGQSGAIAVYGKTGVNINNVDFSVKNTDAIYQSFYSISAVMGQYNAEISLNGTINIKNDGLRTIGFFAHQSSTMNFNDKINISTNSPVSWGFWAHTKSVINFNKGSETNITGKNTDTSLTNCGLLNSNAYVNIHDGAKISNFNDTLASGSDFFRNEYGPPDPSYKVGYGINFYKGATISSFNSLLGTNVQSQVISDINFFNKGNISDLGGFSGKYIDIGNAIKYDSEPEKKEDNNLYNSILNQFNQLINDGSYKGVNLLKEQDLKVIFNEDRSSNLNILGVNATTKGLGLNQADWKSQLGVNKTLQELDSAISQLRSYAGDFGNYYSIVSTREEFTKSMINVLTEGSDKLTLADVNQESANMLSLQTRQQLAINSLSLASQASQSVLRLF